MMDPGLLSTPVGVPNDLPVMYAIMILNETGKPVTAQAIESIILGAGMVPSVDDIAWWLWIEQELEDADVDRLMNPPYQEHPVQIVEDLLPDIVTILPEPEDDEDAPDPWSILFPE